MTRNPTHRSVVLSITSVLGAARSIRNDEAHPSSHPCTVAVFRGSARMVGSSCLFAHASRCVLLRRIGSEVVDGKELSRLMRPGKPDDP